jgi:iron complex outermembrane receptor protein
MRTALLAAGSALALGAAHCAQAQDITAQPVASEAAGGLEDIVVTARRRIESVQSVPVAVTAIPAATIEKLDLTSIEKVASRTPSLNVGRASNGSGAQLTLRGIGSSSTSIGIEQSVAVVVDQAYYGQGRVINEGFFDLGRIEILKGPQALFFGKNATAGVISITSADPTSTPEFKARAAYEFNAQQVQLEFVGAGPITDRLGLRFAVRGSKQFGGWFENIADPVPYDTFDIATGTVIPHTAQPNTRETPGERELLTRTTLKWDATDRLVASLKLSTGFNENDNNSWNYVNFRCATGFSSLNPIYPCEKKFVTHQNRIPSTIAPNFPGAKEDGQLFNRYESYGVTLGLEYGLDTVSLTSVTNYQWNNNKWACACDFQSSPTGTWATEDTTWSAFSQEVRALTRFEGPVNLLGGLLYQKTRRDFDQWIMFAGLADTSQSIENRFLATTKTSFTKGETIALFGQATWQLMPTLELAGGVRYTHETKDSYFTQPYNIAALTFIFRPQDSADGLGEISADQTFNNWSPEFTLTWKPTDQLLVYGAYKTAYKSGGFSNGGINSAFSPDPLSDLTFDPERARGFEGGVKSTLVDRQLRLNLSVYSYAYLDLQVDFFNSPIFAFQTLTADARTSGVEVDFEYAPRSIDGLNLRGSVNWNKARYTDFIGPCYAGQRPSAGCTLLDPEGGLPGAGQTPLFQDLEGAPLSVAPTWTMAVGASYDAPVGNGWAIGVGGDLRYSSSYLASAFNNPASRQDAYVTLDAQLRFGPANDRWRVSVIGKNLSNVFYVTGVVDGPSTGSGTGTEAGIAADQLGFANVPRTVQIEFRTRF